LKNLFSHGYPVWAVINLYMLRRLGLYRYKSMVFSNLDIYVMYIYTLVLKTYTIKYIY
jgi:hypothetical protein